MFGKESLRNQEASPYAAKSDFCRIFENDMNRLYLLSFLLTGDRVIAEQCFVGGLHIAQERNYVFKEWAESWARRAIIQNAIRMIRPRKAADGFRSTREQSSNISQAELIEIAGVVALPTFERFVFVMSVLERYSDQECSLLLGCMRGDVVEARNRALVQLGKSANLDSKLASIRSKSKGRQGHSEPAAQLTVPPGFAVSA